MTRPNLVPIGTQYTAQIIPINAASRLNDARRVLMEGFHPLAVMVDAADWLALHSPFAWERDDAAAYLIRVRPRIDAAVSADARRQVRRENLLAAGIVACVVMATWIGLDVLFAALNGGV